MPKALEEKLEKQADNEGLEGERKDAYVYGTMRKTGWKPKREQTKSQTETMVSALRKRSRK